MGLIASLRTQARASACAAEAEVIELVDALRRWTAMLDSAHSTDALLEGLGGGTSLREDLALERARIRAEVDRLTRQLQASRKRLRLTRALQHSVDRALAPFDSAN